LKVVQRSNVSESDEDSSFPPNSHGIFHSLSQNAEATLKIWERDKTLAAAQWKLQEKLAKITEYAVNEIIQVQREMLNLSMIGGPETLQLLMQHHKEGLS
jgi:hypothetical protein